jgi:hypothetical protein
MTRKQVHNVRANKAQKLWIQAGQENVVIKLPDQAFQPGKNGGQKAAEGALGQVGRPFPTKGEAARKKELTTGF